jgi:mono/diheme cytochrome c family protein
MKTRLKIALALVSCLAVLPAGAADIAHGQQLYKANCLRCHNDSEFTRKDHKVTTADALHRRVQLCEMQLGLKWFDEDIDDVAAYLNQNFYHFK